jgi:ribose/xylose/arabinose/galactoside ABC-type transport system permease subunit
MSLTGETVVRVGSRSALGRFLRRFSLQIGIVGVAAFIWLLFLMGSPRTFLAADIYVAFMSTTPFFALIAIPLTLVVITGEIDLSFPSIMAFGMTAFDWSSWRPGACGWDSPPAWLPEWRRDC